MTTAEVLRSGAPTDRTAAGAAGDPGLACLATLLRLRGVGTDYEQLRLEAGRPATTLAAGDLMRLARRRGLRAKIVRTRPRALGPILPAIAFGRDGGAVVLAKAAGDRVLVVDPALPKPVERSLAWLDGFWAGRLLVVGPGAATAEGPAKLGFAWFVPALVRHRGLFANVLAASLFIQLFGLATPLFTMVVIDKVLTSSNLSTLDVLVIGLLALAVFDAVLGGLRGHLLTHTTHRLDAELGARLFRHLTALPLGWFSQRAVGATLARVKELEAVRGFLTGSALTVLIDLVFTIVFLAVLYAFSPALTAIVAGTVALIGLVHWAVAPAIRRRLQDKFAATSDLDGFLVETVGGIETVKASGAEPVLQRRWEEGAAANARAAFQATSLSAATGHAAGLLNKLMAALILWYGARLVLDGEITAGTLIAFNMLAGRVSAPALRLAQLWQQLQQARVSLAKLSDILETPVERGRAGDRRPLPRLRGAVEFASVTFRYRPDEPAVLDGLTFQVSAGQVVGLTAPSGTGKTTAMKLLQRLYVPEAGRVLVDGIDVGAVEPGWLRRQIGVVPQDVHLFNRSVRDNIAFADPALPMDAVVAAARRAGAHDFIVKLPDGYDTVVGERGCQLSGGQRQRLALARTLAQDPRLLILDEATSALDDAGERAILADLRRTAAGRTVFVVSHRVSALRRCDRVLVLAAGRVVEDGAPGELLARGGRYAALARAQAAEVSPEATLEAAQ